MSVEVENKIDKVMRMAKKAFALARNNPNAEEAQSALLKAQEALARYGLAESDIDVNDIPNGYTKEVNTETVWEDDKTLPWWADQLSFTISKNFRCTSFLSGKRKLIKFIGLKEDVELASEVFAEAVYIMTFHTNLYIANNGIKGRSAVNVAKNDFMKGFILGLKDKFAEQVDKNGWGLILAQDGLVKQAVEDLKLGKPVTRTISFGNGHARAEGYKEGKSFSTQKRVGE
jgi:hypothetical protein